MLSKTQTSATPMTRILSMAMVGTDSLAAAAGAPPTRWEVVSGLQPWLTLNGVNIAANNSIDLPPTVGVRLDQTSSWIVSINVTVSPAGLSEQPEPYATDLVLGVYAQVSSGLPLEDAYRAPR